MDIGYAEVITVILLIAGGWWWWKRDPRLAHLPPHVRGWPLINQTLLQAKDNPIPYVQKWAKQYGELFCTTSGTSLFVWVSGRKAFKELVDRRSAIYSSKPPAPMAQRASGGKRVTFMQYGREWRALRNILHRLLTPAMSRSYSPIQEYEAKQFTVDLLDRPNDFYMHNRRYAASVIMQVTYGHAIPVCSLPLFFF
jgi:cytochrome P450